MKWMLSNPNRIFTLFFSFFLLNPAFAKTENSVDPLQNWDSFFSVYFETAYLNRAGTGAGLFVPRAGFYRPETGTEIYAVARTGIDSRTFLEESDQIYNDNFLFFGVGIDQRRWLPGFRFMLQVGYSADLNPKIHLGGADGRVGFMSYHEQEWIRNSLRTEIYSEAFYVRRYRNLLGSFHLRNFWPALTSGANRYQGTALGPEVQVVVSGDTAVLDYNRFVEAQYGARAELHTPFALGTRVYGVSGARLEKLSPVGNYQDFRVLLYGSFEIQ